MCDLIKNKFDFPVHFHSEYELNFIQQAANCERIVGDHKDLIDKMKLVLVGPNIYHGWNNGQCKSDQIHEITIQFHCFLIHESLLAGHMMKPLGELLSNAAGRFVLRKYNPTNYTKCIYKLSQNHSGIMPMNRNVNTNRVSEDRTVTFLQSLLPAITAIIAKKKE